MGLEELGVGYHIGRVRKTNQDALAVLLPYAEEWGGLLVIADGMGGHQGGQIASGRVVSDLGHWFQSNELDHWLSLPSFHHRLPILAEALVRRVRTINSDLFRWGQHCADLRHMGTTATVAWFYHNALVIVHVGDSRAYRWRRGQLQPLTQDHSWVADQVRQDLLTPKEAMYHARRNQVLKALGTESHVDIDRHLYNIESGDVIVLCSDGLTSYYSDEELQHIFACNNHQPLQSLCDKLIHGALIRGGGDNISLLIARLSPTLTSTLKQIALVRREVSPAYEQGMATIDVSPQLSQIPRPTTHFWLVLAVMLWTLATIAFFSPFILQSDHFGMLWGLGTVALLFSIPMLVLSRRPIILRPLYLMLPHDH